MSAAVVALVGAGVGAVLLIGALAPPNEETEWMVAGSQPAAAINYEFPSGVRRAYRKYPSGSYVAMDPLDDILNPISHAPADSVWANRYH